MSEARSTQCPNCDQFVPAEVPRIKTRDGKNYHEGCAKEIAEGYIKLTMKSGAIKPNPNQNPNQKPKPKPQRTPQKNKNKKKGKNDSQTDPSA